MNRVSIVLVGSVFLAAALAAAAQEKPAVNNAAKKELAEPYESFRADQTLLRKHLILKFSDGRKDMTTSSIEASNRRAARDGCGLMVVGSRAARG